MESEKGRGTNGKNKGNAALAAVDKPQSVAIASRGIRDDQDAAEYLSTLIGDIMTEAVPVRIANAGINAMGKLLKLVDMRQKYGSPERTRSLRLVSDESGVMSKRQELLDQLAALDAASGKVID